MEANYKKPLSWYDTDGILINTPDLNYKSSKYKCGWWIIGQFNKGVPYNWGVFYNRRV